MSAMNIFKTANAVHLWTDGAFYDPKGTLLATGQKVAIDIRHRGDGNGYPDNFAKAVVEHKERYGRKLDGMRQHASDSLRALIENAEASIASIAAAEIERVRSAGNVDFAA
jgi:hypothetical protein